MSRAFLVDTNVLSELMRSQPDQQVVSWFDMHIDAECYTSSITKAEIFLGIALLPEGIRRTRLTAIAEKSFHIFFYHNRITPAPKRYDFTVFFSFNQCMPCYDDRPDETSALKQPKQGN